MVELDRKRNCGRCQSVESGMIGSARGAWCFIVVSQHAGVNARVRRPRGLVLHRCIWSVARRVSKSRLCRCAMRFLRGIGGKRVCMSPCHWRKGNVLG